MRIQVPLLATSLALASATASGQGCVIDTDSPAQITGARRYVGLLASQSMTAKTDEKPKHFRNAVRVLVEESNNVKNEMGRWYLLGKAYAFWLQDTTHKSITTREDVGLTTNPKGPHDIFAAIDSAFSKVEALNPACADSTRQYRENAYVREYARAVKALGEKKWEEAEQLSRRALVVAPRQADPWNVIAQAKQGMGDMVAYKAMLMKVVEVTAGSKVPAQVRYREGAYYNLGVMTANAAQASQDAAQKKTLAEEAAGYFRESLKSKPDDAAVQAALGRALALSGDTAAVQGIFRSMVNEPGKYTYQQLIEAGTNAAQAGQFDDGIKLLRNGLEKNPFFRIGLFNLTSALQKAQQFDAMVEVCRRLIAVEPNNPDNFHQTAAAWQGVLATATDDTKKKAAQDSIIHYIIARDSAKVAVKFAPFQPAAGSPTVLSGRVENRSTAAHAYSVTVEFLDATGKVVATETASTGELQPRTFKEVQLSPRGAGIVAYRVKPVT